MGLFDFFKRNKGGESISPMAIPQTLIGGRKGHKGQFSKAVRKRRVRNAIAKMSRKANR